MKRFLLMIQFFTRIPVNMVLPSENEDFKEGSIYLPLVGLIVGCICAAAYYIACLSGNTLFAAAAAVLVWAGVTGAIHLDGLSDTCDGIFSSRSKKKILEIMKDSRIGTMGALALIFAVLLKISLIAGFGRAEALYSIVLSPVIARTSLLYGTVIAKYPREKGMGQLFIGSVTMREFFKGLIIFLIIILPFVKLYLTVLVLMVFIVPKMINSYMESKIGGMTGDTLGALCEIQEILSLMVLHILSGYIWR